MVTGRIYHCPPASVAWEILQVTFYQVPAHLFNANSEPVAVYARRRVGTLEQAEASGLSIHADTLLYMTCQKCGRESHVLVSSSCKISVTSLQVPQSIYTQGV